MIMWSSRFSKSRKFPNTCLFMYTLCCCALLCIALSIVTTFLVIVVFALSCSAGCGSYIELFVFSVLLPDFVFFYTDGVK